MLNVLTQTKELQAVAARSGATKCYKVLRASRTQLCEKPMCWRPNRLVPSGVVSSVHVVHSSYVRPRGRLAEFVFEDGLRVYVIPAYDDGVYLYFFIQAGPRVVQSDC